MSKITIYLNRQYLEKVSLKKWYKATYPDDPIIKELANVNLRQVLEGLEKGQFYKAIGVVDTVVRERVFLQFQIYTLGNNTYSDFYDIWIENERQ